MIFRSDLSTRHVARHRQLGGHCISSRNAQPQARPCHTLGSCSSATFPWESHMEQVSGEVTQFWKDVANSHLFLCVDINLLPSLIMAALINITWFMLKINTEPECKSALLFTEQAGSNSSENTFVFILRACVYMCIYLFQVQ